MVLMCIKEKKTNVTKQIHDNYAPHCVRVHCMAHHINLVVQTLSKLSFMICLEFNCKPCIPILHIHLIGTWSSQNLQISWKQKGTKFSKM
jgi:hypothetical protein